MVNDGLAGSSSLGPSALLSVFAVSLCFSACPVAVDLFAQGAGTAATLERHERQQKDHETRNPKGGGPATAPSLPAQPTESSASVPSVAVDILKKAQSAPGAAQPNRDVCVVDLSAPGGGTMDSQREAKIRRDLGAVLGFFQHLNRGSASPELLDHLSRVDTTIAQFSQSSSVLDDWGLEILADSMNQGLIESGLMEVGADGQVRYLKTADSQGFIQMGDQRVRTDEVLNYLWQKHCRPKMVQAVGEEKTQEFEKNCAFGMGFCSRAGCRVGSP